MSLSRFEKLQRLHSVISDKSTLKLPQCGSEPPELVLDLNRTVGSVQFWCGSAGADEVRFTVRGLGVSCEPSRTCSHRNRT